MSKESVDRHKGHDVVCMVCNLLAREFIDYEKALKRKRAMLYAKNKCSCTYTYEFYCNDCNEKIILDSI